VWAVSRVDRGMYGHGFESLETSNFECNTARFGLLKQRSLRVVKQQIARQNLIALDLPVPKLHSRIG